MKVLWSVFIVFPEVAALAKMKPQYACTWVRAMAEKLRYKDDVELAVVAVGNSPETKQFEVNNIKFYFLPGNRDTYRTGGGVELNNAWKTILEDFKPDIIHIYGTEVSHNHHLLNMDIQIPIVVSLQGILTDYKKSYYGGIDVSTALKNTTLRDIVRGSGIIMDRMRLAKPIKEEKAILRKAKYVEGRTFWDYASVRTINPSIKYYFCPRLIRHEFYTEEGWRIEDIQRHTIFMHQGFKPIKGLHFLLEAVNRLKSKYPDIKLYLSGNDNLRPKTLKQKLMINGYCLYINKIIKKYNLQSHIVFTGVLDAERMVEYLKKSHVMVLPSAIENSPNSLVEAMLVGTPSISSFVGGVPGMLKHEEEGLLYCYDEVNVLTYYIERIFDSDELAEKFSKAARARAFHDHDEDMLVTKLIGIYKEIINDERKEKHE